MLNIALGELVFGGVAGIEFVLQRGADETANQGSCRFQAIESVLDGEEWGFEETRDLSRVAVLTGGEVDEHTLFIDRSE